ASAKTEGDTSDELSEPSTATAYNFPVHLLHCDGSWPRVFQHNRPIEDNQNSAVYEAVAEKANEKNVRRGLRQRDVKTAAESGRIVEARRWNKNPIAQVCPKFVFWQDEKS
ncbi:hypothetical protein, partial [Janthinobacterium lividum]